MGTSLVERKQPGADPPVRQLPLGLESPAHPADSAAGAARHLLARRSVLDDTLQRPPLEGATILLRTPPTPAALLLLAGRRARERFKNLLHMANLEVDVCNVAADALERLSIRVHALMFTDNLDHHPVRAPASLGRRHTHRIRRRV